MRITVAAAALLWWGAGEAPAKTAYADSLEWMTVDAELVVRGQVLSHKDTKGPGRLVYRDVVVRVEETLKGTIRPEELLKGKFSGKYLTVRLALDDTNPTGVNWRTSGRPYLFFLQRAKAAVGKGLAGKVVPRQVTGPRQPLAIDLHAPEGVYTADMKVAKDAKKILAQVRKYAGRPHRGSEQLDVPSESEAHRELYGGSACYLLVPGGE